MGGQQIYEDKGKIDEWIISKRIKYIDSMVSTNLEKETMYLYQLKVKIVM